MKFKELDPSLQRAMYVVLLAFLGMFAATYYTVRLTIFHFEPVVDKNYYETGLNFEKNLLTQKELQEKGFTISSSLFQNSQFVLGKNQVEFQIAKNGIPYDTGSAFLRWERSATVRESGKQELHSMGSGRFIGEVELPGRGTWLVSLETEIEGKKFEQSKIIYIP